ncbi:MAG TPA: DNA repair exonuclease [Pirellulaceae bacterium]|nr:DNA repair exonuclease [Pirellulaceae bacterium]
MPMRFLHTADWQIGMKAAHVGQVGERVRQERLEAGKRVIQAAHDHGAEFIVVAGDTFEDNAVDRVLVQRVADILAAFRGPVYIIAGNHDPLAPGSVWEHRAWNSHSNLHILRETQPLPVAGGWLYPSPLKEKHSTQDPTLWVQAHDRDEICLGLAHGTVQGIAQDELDYPIARDAATRGGLDYLAIGHWHSTAHYPGAPHPTRMAYSGTHETTKFGERDSGNVLLVEIATRGAPPSLTSIRTGGLTWLQPEPSETEIREIQDIERLVTRLETLPAPERTLVDLRLSGILPSGAQPALQRLRELAAARCCYYRINDDGLLPSPHDETWIEALPAGVLRETALRLRSLADPTNVTLREPQQAPPVAARALLELYRYWQESAS